MPKILNRVGKINNQLSIMKKLLILTGLVTCMLTLNSCGEKSKDATLTPKSTSLQGDLRDYFTIVEHPYVVKYDENNWLSKYMISIELQRTDAPFSFDTEGLEPVGTFGQGVYGNFGIGIEVYDAESNLILSKSASEGGMQGVYSSDDLKNLLTLAAGETGFVRWSAKEFENHENKEFSFKLTSYLKIDKKAKKSAKTKSSSSSNYDDVDDIYNSASKEASKMYERAQKEAEKMYQDALDEISNR